MSSSTIAATAGRSTSSRAAMPNRAVLSAVMLAGCAIAAAAAGLLAPSLPNAAALPADPALARLMQGMAVVKLAFVAAMAGLLVWRFGRPMTPAITLGCLACIWISIAATVLIWQSSWLGLASVLFHGAGFAFLMLALRDDRAAGRAAPALTPVSARGR